MYIAMNRFNVNAGREEVFEEIWRKRDSYLDQVPGFKEFHLLRGETREGITTYLSHSIWASRQAPAAWLGPGPMVQKGVVTGRSRVWYNSRVPCHCRRSYVPIV